MCARIRWSSVRYAAHLSAAIGSLSAFAIAGGPTVDLDLDPAAYPVVPTQEFDVDLIALTASPPPVEIATVDAILTWDPLYFDLLSVSTSPGLWLASGFFPDPDGINASLTDGNALFVALAPPGDLAVVPPDLSCATFRFRARTELGFSTIQLISQSGSFARTRVLGAGIQNDITGDISGAQTTVRVWPILLGDMNCDGFITVGDISPFVLALVDPDAYIASFPFCNILNGDTNEDLFVTVGDIATFVGLIVGGG
ncbi:MAG: hypothetical protein SF069_10535 [Phycisphaerae bacterium]|nr:hypothetical protein [Phycisphaerae bacterium]